MSQWGEKTSLISASSHPPSHGPFEFSGRFQLGLTCSISSPRSTYITFPLRECFCWGALSGSGRKGCTPDLKLRHSSPVKGGPTETIQEAALPTWFPPA